MEMADVYEKLRRQVNEEKADSDVYCEMAKCAEEAGKEDLAFGLWLISADEKSHEDFIRSYMEHDHDH